MNTICNLVHGLMYRLALTLLQIATRSAGKAHLEVERKFQLTGAQAGELPAKLAGMNFLPAGEVVMTDTFLPANKEGDMVRVRQEVHNGASQTLLTLKSWVKTPDGGKERKESERAIGAIAKWCLMHSARNSGKGALPSFSKSRQLFEGKLS